MLETRLCTFVPVVPSPGLLLFLYPERPFLQGNLHLVEPLLLLWVEVHSSFLGYAADLLLGELSLELLSQAVLVCLSDIFLEYFCSSHLFDFAESRKFQTG